MTIRSIRSAGSFPGGPSGLHPEHLYKFAALLFLFAVLFRFFDIISRFLLIVYAAAIFAVAMNALVRRVPLQRRWVAGLLGLVILGLFVAGLWFGGSALLRQLRGLAESFPAIEQEMRAWGDELRARLGLDVEVIGERVSRGARDFFSGLSGTEVAGRAGGLLEALTVPVLIFFGGLFALAKPNDRLLVPLLQAVPEERRPAFRRLFLLLGERLTGWLKGQVVSMATIGLLATVAFYLIGVPYALLFGVVNGLAEFVPIIGPWVGGIPAVVVAFIDDPMKGVWTTLAILAIQQLESQLITPLVMSKTAEVHPFVTLFSIVLFGGLFGFLGILLALPLVLLIWTAVQVLWVERAIHAGGDDVRDVVKE